ncbi:snRNA-activating protein complex subunit 5-like [Exaiptasia diaphana]|uniref:Uncharacterized protein n=1 Tax=Exaiptasia diaphana TaxID=2652724 RepID=A0A913X4Y7_EXADI|nr:snRNA-activating protein complex subunit 5-like [Exaiptasia diaphana]
MNLAKSILEKEELFLKEIKNKCVEQLNRLKVEEMALQTLLASSDQLTQTDTETVVQNDISDSRDDSNTLNKLPLENLYSQPTLEKNIEEEDEIP